MNPLAEPHDKAGTTQTGSTEEHEVVDLVELAMAQAPGERERFLEAMCPNKQLLAEAIEYLKDEERLNDFLKEPFFNPAGKDCPFEAGDLLEGRFLIVREVARGGMGIVYEAFDQKLERRVAIKCGQQGFRKRLPPEVRNAREISHTNVCKIFDIHRTNSRSGALDFISMEFLEGETLQERLLQGTLTKDEATEIACQICAGLNEAHRNQVIHGDLKTGNVILTKSAEGGTRAVITDFGLARRPEPDSEETGKKAAGGTREYMAPELLLRGRQSSVSSDIYALGVVLRQLLPDAERAKAKWEPVIQRCTADDPAKRFASAEEVAETLSPTITGKHWGAYALLGLGLLCAALAWIVYFTQKTPVETVRLAVLPFDTDPASEPIGRALLQDTADRLKEAKSGRVRLTLIPFADAVKNKVTGPESVGQKLGATHALWGSLRNENGVTVVQAHLTDSGLNIQLSDWSARYSASELRNMPVALSGMVAGRLGLPPLSDAKTVEQAAYKAWSQGVALLRGDPKDIDAALGLLSEAASKDNNSPLTQARLAEAQLQKYLLSGEEKWWDLAHESLTSAEERNPDTAEVRLVSGMLNDAKGKYDQAEADLQRAIEIQPENGDLWRQLGIVYRHKNRNDSALQAFHKALDLQPGYYRNYSELGAFYYDRYDFEEAVKQYKEMVKAAPGLAEAHYQLSRPYVDMGHFAEAEREARSAIAIRETSDAVHIVALSLMLQNRDKEAIRYYLRALELGPPARHKYILFLNLAGSYRRSGQRAPARENYVTALKLAYEQLTRNPADAMVRADVSFISACLGRRIDAEINAKQALASAAADDVVTKWMVVQTYNMLEERDQAIELLRDAPAWLLERVRQFSDFGVLQKDARYIELVAKRGLKK